MCKSAIAFALHKTWSRENTFKVITNKTKSRIKYAISNVATHLFNRHFANLVLQKTEKFES